MIGIALAVLYLAWLNLVRGTIFGAAYYHATNFFLWWHIIWSIVTGLILIGLAVLTTLILNAAAAEKVKGKIGGKVLSLAISGTFSVLSAIIFVFRCSLSIGGVYLLHTAIIVNGDKYAYSWDSNRLFLGAVLLIFSFLLSKMRSRR